MKRYEKGALVKTSDGRFATIIRGSYGHKFMDVSDWEMVNFGMGHMAGSYGIAVDIIFHDSGITIRSVKPCKLREINEAS